MPDDQKELHSQTDHFADSPEAADEGMFEEPAEDEARVRTIGVGVSIAIMLAVAGTFVFNTISHGTPAVDGGADERARAAFMPLPSLVLSRMKVRDTVYTTDSLYLDVNLAKQTVAVRFRDGSSRRFLISSGNPYIREGMSTPVGVYTVQNQVPMALSKQFNNARLHHWIGVQGGVGFHGLDGSGYYGNLGVRPSSHGCIRMSREEIAQMYKLVHPGALIVIHYGSPARVVAFCEPSDTVGSQVIDSAAVYDRGLGTDRMASLMGGTYWTKPVRRLVHLAGQRFRWGMQIGDADKIPKQQLPESPVLADFAQHIPVVQSDVVALRNDRYAGRLADTLRAIAMRERMADSTDRTSGMMGD